jgi:hypothetical protein
VNGNSPSRQGDKVKENSPSRQQGPTGGESFSPVPPHAPAQAKELLSWAIRNCARRVSESPDLRAEALVLVGSMARGEASVLESENGLVCLSDMEFLLAVKNDRRARQRMQAVRALTEQVTREAAARSLECSFEFTPTSLSYFCTARPCIFASEVHQHGKVVWGEPSLLRTMPDAGIPEIDALYLVCNRLVEQLAWRERICSDAGLVADRLFAYSLVKTYVDLGTSLLVFTGNYESTYARRAERLSSLRDALCGEIEDFDLLLERIAANSRMKLWPEKELLEVLRKEVALNRWAELARSVLRVWKWELRQLARERSQVETDDVVAFARNCSPWERFRDWAKLARTAAMNAHWSDLLRATYFCGSPRNRLYVEAAARYAKLAQLESEFPFVQSNVKSFLPIRPRADLPMEQGVGELVRIWNTYFRNS